MILVSIPILRRTRTSNGEAGSGYWASSAWTGRDKSHLKAHRLLSVFTVLTNLQLHAVASHSKHLFAILLDSGKDVPIGTPPHVGIYIAVVATFALSRVLWSNVSHTRRLLPV